MPNQRVSLVIPAYNEAEHLRACLDSVFAQTVAPYEVIVVDNNSSDETQKIARSYAGVRVLHERRQGVVFARRCGFDAAKGDVIGRIDADTLLPTDWIESVIRSMREFPDVAAVTGSVRYYDVALSRVFNACDGYFRRVLARQFGSRDLMFLQGANMALRREWWPKVREQTCDKGGIHEDFDLAIHLQEAGGSIVYDDRLVAGISARRTDVNFLSFANYVYTNPHTYAVHGKHRPTTVYGVMCLVLLVYLPARILYRGFNPDVGKFSLKRLFTGRTRRPDPSVV